MGRFPLAGAVVCAERRVVIVATAEIRVGGWGRHASQTSSTRAGGVLAVVTVPAVGALHCASGRGGRLPNCIVAAVPLLDLLVGGLDCGRQGLFCDAVDASVDGREGCLDGIRVGGRGAFPGVAVAGRGGGGGGMGEELPVNSGLAEGGQV